MRKKSKTYAKKKVRERKGKGQKKSKQVKKEISNKR
jgi:hypothetical protein